MNNKNSFASSVYNYFAEFKVLGTASRDFWLTNGIQFFDGLAYFSMIHIITLYLTTNCGFSDYDSGKWVSIFTLYVTAFVFAIGSIVDVIGLKKSFYGGFALLCIARFGLGWGADMCHGSMASVMSSSGITDFLKMLHISWTPDFTVKQFVVMVSIVILSLGTAFMTPVVQAALRRYTTKENRATGFNLYYLFMNVSAVIATLVVIDWAREYFGPVEGNLWIMNFGFTATLGIFFCTYFLRENNFADESERLDEKKTAARRPLAIFSEVWRERAFQKLVLFLLLTMGVRLVFTLQFLVIPKYYVRVLYEDFKLGFANSINPIIIVVGLIVIIPIINKYTTMRLMIVGMTISALSLVFMVLPIEWFLMLPWIHTLSQAFIFVIFTQIILFAIGELLFNPRFTEYVASAAPKDKVASYMALSALPMFIAKPINGFLSGLLVSVFCYEGIRAKIDSSNIAFNDSPQFMWAIYFVFALLSPLLIIAFKKWLTVTEADKKHDKQSDAEMEERILALEAGTETLNEQQAAAVNLPPVKPASDSHSQN